MKKAIGNLTDIENIPCPSSDMKLKCLFHRVNVGEDLSLYNI